MPSNILNQLNPLQSHNTSSITLIVAFDKNRVIGLNGALPWHYKEDLAWFYQNTKGHNIVMGWNNYLDIMKYTNNKPLKERNNILLTRQHFNDFHDNSLYSYNYIDRNIETIKMFNDIPTLIQAYQNEELMIIGGQKVYEQFLPIANKLIITEIEKEFIGDTYFPLINYDDFSLTFNESIITTKLDPLSFKIYQKNNFV